MQITLFGAPMETVNTMICKTPLHMNLGMRLALIIPVFPSHDGRIFYKENQQTRIHQDDKEGHGLYTTTHLRIRIRSSGDAPPSTPVDHLMEMTIRTNQVPAGKLRYEKPVTRARPQPLLYLYSDFCLALP